MVRVPQRKAVLILGNYRPTLTVAKALREDGYRVVVSASDRGDAGACYSRFVDEMWEHPPIDLNGGAEFEEALVSFLGSRPDVRTVFPVAEEFVLWLARNVSVVPPTITVVSPDPKLVTLCLDKAAVFDVAMRAGVTCAPCAVVNTVGELHARSDGIGYPIIVRPFSHLVRLGHKKAVICWSKNDLHANFPSWPANQSGLLIQRYVKGTRHDLYFIAIDGEIRSLLEIRITRTDHPDGTGLSTEGEYVPVSPAFADDTQRLVRALNYTGIGFVQFIQNHQTGERTFLEINPRTAGSHRCAEGVGMPLTRAALALARGQTGLDLTPDWTYPIGGYYTWLSGDFHGLKEAIAHREIGPAGAMRWVFLAGRSLWRARIHLTFSWDDMLPSTALLVRQLIRTLMPRFDVGDLAAHKPLPSASVSGGKARQLPGVRRNHISTVFGRRMPTGRV